MMSFVSQSERFNSVERTNTSLSVGLEVGWEGRVGWQRQEWLALNQFGILNCMHLSVFSTTPTSSRLNFIELSNIRAPSDGVWRYAVPPRLKKIAYLTS